LSDFSKNHPYTLKFEKGMRLLMKNLRKGEKKSYRTLSLKIIHRLDSKDTMRRDDLLHAVTAMNDKYTDEIVDDWLRKLHAQKLITVSMGRYSDVVIA
jgi:hypothetical protein